MDPILYAKALNVGTMVGLLVCLIGANGLFVAFLVLRAKLRGKGKNKGEM